MDYFEGFNWSVPRSFTDALRLCKFEEGDILYSKKIAYEGRWSDRPSEIGHYLQVRYPEKAMGNVAKEAGSVFSNNWNNEVRLDLYQTLNKSSAVELCTTQGRLYTLLWKGDMSCIAIGSDEPSLPLLVRAVTNNIEEARSKALQVSNGSPVLVMAHDLASQVSNEKRAKIMMGLQQYIVGSSPVIMAPLNVGIMSADMIAPTIQIELFIAKKGVRTELLAERVKDSVYVKGKEAKRESYRLSAHGAIFSGEN